MINKIKNTINSNSNFKELLKGSSIAFIFKILGMSLGYILTIIIARYYGSDTLGFFVLSITILNIFVTISLLGFDTSIVKFIAEYNSKGQLDLVKSIIQKSIIIVLPFSLLLSIILYNNADFVSKIFFDNEAGIIFIEIIALSIIPLAIIRLNSAIFRGFKNIKLYSLFEQVLIYLFTILLLVLSFNFSKESINTISAQSIALVIVSIISFIFIYFKIKIFDKVYYSFLEYKDILKVSIPMFLTASMALVMGWTDIIMLGFFLDESQVGIYSVAVKIASLSSIALLAVNAISAPKISECYSNNKMDELAKVSQASTKMIFYISLPIIIILLLFNIDILLMFGKEFIIASTSLLILMLGQSVNAFTGSVGLILNMTGKQVVFNKVILFASTLNLILNYFFIQMYGLEGAAIATSISICFLQIVPYILVKKYYGFYSFNLKAFQ